MAVSLSKGANVNLSKEAPGLNKIVVGLGWSKRVTDGAAFDLDASAFLLKVDGKVKDDGGFVFFGNKKAGDGAVVHAGDNLTGTGDGDDETVAVNLGLIPADIERITFAVTIYDAEARKQNFGQVSNAYIRVVNQETGVEIARYDLSEDASVETSMVFGELYRSGTEFKFKAVGQGFAGGMYSLAALFGVSV